jgi:hypothetical protein
MGYTVSMFVMTQDWFGPVIENMLKPDASWGFVLKFILGAAQLINASVMGHYATWQVLTALAGFSLVFLVSMPFVRPMIWWIYQHFAKKTAVKSMAVKEKTAVMYASGEKLRSLVFDMVDQKKEDPAGEAAQQLIDQWLLLREQAKTEDVESIRRDLGLPLDAPREKEIARLHTLFNGLFDAELESHHSLFHPIQLDHRPPLGLTQEQFDKIKIAPINTSRAEVLLASEIRKHLYDMGAPSGQSINTGINLADQAAAFRDAGMAGKIRFLLAMNRYSADVARPMK